MNQWMKEWMNQSFLLWLSKSEGFLVSAFENNFLNCREKTSFKNYQINVSSQQLKILISYCIIVWKDSQLVL